jgi:tRNA A-37 threonylcarbamoyl transferase component Bud32
MSSFRDNSSFSSSSSPSPIAKKFYRPLQPRSLLSRKSKSKSKSRSKSSSSSSSSSSSRFRSSPKSKKNLWRVASSKVVKKKFPALLPLNAVPKSFDKIKENCDLISKWWKGIRMDQVSKGCDLECKKKNLSNLARKANIKLIGEGTYGAVYAACKDDNCADYILKIQTANEDFVREVYAMTELNGWEYSPRIYDAWSCDGIGFMVIENMGLITDCLPPDTTKDEILRQLDVMLSELHAKGWVHVDTHSGNIMCKNGHLALIDFGWAVKFPESKFQTVDIKHPLSKRLAQDTLYTKNYLLAAETENKLKAVNAIYNVITLQANIAQPLKGIHRMSQRRRQMYSSSTSKSKT